MLRSKPNSRAMTMLEVIVVIGVLATVGTILIPLVAQVRRGVGDVGCQNNLRQLLQALDMYVMDHNGSMPYGKYYVGAGPPTWGPPPGGNGEFVSWASALNGYFNTPGGYAPAFKCPVAEQQVPPHLISYVMNMIVAVSPHLEVIFASPPNAQTKPPRVHLMRTEGTALIWDTAIQPNWADDEGYLIGADIDEQRFWSPDVPQLRYYSPHDPFAQIPPGTRGNNRPIVFPSSFRNIDPEADSSYPYQGNLRFRHHKQTQCNVAFSDGSVRQFTAVIDTNNGVASHNALRRHFMINWPPGVTPNPNFPNFGDPGGGGVKVVKKPRRFGAVPSDPGSSSADRD